MNATFAVAVAVAVTLSTGLRIVVSLQQYMGEMSVHTDTVSAAGFIYTESEAAADFRSGSGRPKKATADCRFSGGFFGLTTAGMKIGGGFQQNLGDDPLWYESHHGNIFRNHRSGISM